MSKQLAISSAFAIFAMVSLSLSATAGQAPHAGESGLISFEADFPSLELPAPALFQ